MRIISNFKYINQNRINNLTLHGDVVVVGSLKYIRTLNGYVSELGTFCKYIAFSEYIAIIKREEGEKLEELLLEGEKRCYYNM